MRFVILTIYVTAKITAFFVVCYFSCVFLNFLCRNGGVFRWGMSVFCSTK